MRVVFLPFVAALSIASASCMASFEEARLMGIQDSKGAAPSFADPARDERCRKYDADRRVARARATALGAIAGTTAGGVGVAEIVDKNREVLSPGLRIGIAFGGLVAGALALHQDSIADDLGVTWARECSQ